VRMRDEGGPVRRSFSEGGFTLVEVLAALAVAAIAFTVLLQTDALNHTRTIRARLFLDAVHLGGARLEDVFAGGVPSLPEEQGEQGIYQWTRTVAESPFPGVMEVAVVVSWPEGSGKGSYRVAAFLPQ
jgi:prepilin-type N-terminal cleavage/methylation domain-containing protein